MIRKIFICLALCCVNSLLIAQEALTYTIASTQKGDTINVKLTFNVTPGMHVYAPSNHNESQGYITMKVLFNSLPDGLERLPQTSWSASSFSGGGEVYIGAGHTAVFRFLKKGKISFARINGALSYQACNESVCFPPEEKEFSIELQAVKTKRRNISKEK